jgi:hypothetical protein
MERIHEDEDEELSFLFVTCSDDDSYSLVIIGMPDSGTSCIATCAKVIPPTTHNGIIVFVIDIEWSTIHIVIVVIVINVDTIIGREW